MSGYLSNLLTNTTSRYNSLRRNLLSDEADGDTEDDSHISRVLRAYYTEKGRSLPQWLPPDPRKTQQTTSAQSSYQSIWQSSTAPTQPSPNLNNSRPSGGLSDLWDNAPRNNTASQPTSLRRQPGQRPPGGHIPQQQQAYEQVQARPLPSQRAGSYQTQRQQYSDPSPPPSSGSTTSGGGTAQERLKARLYGSARSASPGAGGGGRFG